MARIARLLNVLVVEDSENDTELLLKELERKGYTPIHERVQTPADMALALERHEWDVVLSGLRHAAVQRAGGTGIIAREEN